MSYINYNGIYYKKVALGELTKEELLEVLDDTEIIEDSPIQTLEGETGISGNEQHITNYPINIPDIRLL